jgi:hypothetical protein
MFRVLVHQIPTGMLLDLPDPDSLVLDPNPAQDPSIIEQI